LVAADTSPIAKKIANSAILYEYSLVISSSKKPPIAKKIANSAILYEYSLVISCSKKPPIARKLPKRRFCMSTA
jgi:hypothetical protein